MAHKSGVLLSLIILLQFLLLSGNIIHYQIQVARAYAILPIVNDYLAFHGEINQEIKEYALETSNAEITCVDRCFAFSGEFLHYRMEVTIDPIFSLFAFTTSQTLVLFQKVLIGY